MTTPNNHWKFSCNTDSPIVVSVDVQQQGTIISIAIPALKQQTKDPSWSHQTSQSTSDDLDYPHEIDGELAD